MFPFTINNTLKMLSHNAESTEDDIIKTKITQTIFQALGSKKNVKINAIVVIECDNEPKRTLIVNESSNVNVINSNNIHIASTIANNMFGSISTNSGNGHTGVLLQQPPLFSTTIEDLQALFNMNSSNLACQNVSASDQPNQLNLSFISTQNSNSELCSKNDKPIVDNNDCALSSRKRKSEKPIKIPQDPSTDSNGLDLSVNVKQEHSINNDNEIKLEKFFNLPIWPCVTSADMKSITAQAAPIMVKSKKSMSISGHKKSSKVFNCNQCKLQFNSLNALCKHTFSDHRAFRCTFCSANFTQRSNLQRHSLKHVGFKPFICNVCSKAYYRKDHLVRHIEVSHPGSDPKSNITVKLSSSECLEYLERMQNDRRMEIENVEESKETMDNLNLESVEKSSSLFENNILEGDNSPVNDVFVGNNQSESATFISFIKDEMESPDKLQIAVDDNREINRHGDLMFTNLSDDSYLEKCQEKVLKNCI